jgi:hypothetical protein
MFRNLRNISKKINFEKTVYVNYCTIIQINMFYFSELDNVIRFEVHKTNIHLNHYMLGTRINRFISLMEGHNNRELQVGIIGDNIGDNE